MCGLADSLINLTLQLSQPSILVLSLPVAHSGYFSCPTPRTSLRQLQLNRIIVGHFGEESIGSRSYVRRPK
jgi:hypothetical protein